MPAFRVQPPSHPDLDEEQKKLNPPFWELPSYRLGLIVCAVLLVVAFVAEVV